jgi:hypothetical protein
MQSRARPCPWYPLELLRPRKLVNWGYRWQSARCTRMASGVSPDSTEDPPGQGAPDMPPPPLLDALGLESERYSFLTQRPLSRYDTYRKPLLTVFVTASLVPLFTSATTEALLLGFVLTFRSVVAYLLPMILSRRTGAIVSEAELVGFGTDTTSTGRQLVPRLSCWPRAAASPRDESTDAVEAGAGYASCGSSPGMTAPATPAPNAVITAVGRAMRTTRAARGGRIALRGRGLDTCSQSPEQMRPKCYLRQESKQFGHVCPTPTQGLDGIFLPERVFIVT